MTKWHARTGAPCEGQALPFGCAVSYLPTQLRERIGKAAPRTKVGICVGDRLHTGATWSGECVVLDMDGVVNNNLCVDAHETWGYKKALYN